MILALDIRQLRYFIAVAEEQNICRAAVRLYISQPPLTRQIQLLEAELGTELFIRTHWGVKLTQAGEFLLAHARNIASYVELAREQVQLASKGLLGRIDVGIFGSAMLNIIPQILNTFTEKYPDVKVVLHTLSKGKQIEALHQGRILISFERYMPASPGLQIEQVSREALSVALNQRNPLAQFQQIQAHQLCSEPLIGEVDHTAAIKAVYEQYDLDACVVQRAADMISAVVMVAGGFGTAIVPDSLKTLQLHNVVYRPLVCALNPLLELHCAYRKDEKSPLLANLLQTVRQYRQGNAAALEPVHDLGERRSDKAKMAEKRSL